MMRKIYLVMVFLLTVVQSMILILSAHAEETAVPRDAQVFKTERAFTAKVTIGERMVFGKSKYGERRIIPITGGTFEGPNIKGEVVPGGADWQLLRPDGGLELYARYTLKTHDGFFIQVINRVLIHTPPNVKEVGPYVRSVPQFEAPIGSPYEWLNQAIFLGTLTPGKPEPGKAPYVIIGVHRVL